MLSPCTGVGIARLEHKCEDAIRLLFFSRSDPFRALASCFLDGRLEEKEEEIAYKPTLS